MVEQATDDDLPTVKLFNDDSCVNDILCKYQLSQSQLETPPGSPPNGTNSPLQTPPKVSTTNGHVSPTHSPGAGATITETDVRPVSLTSAASLVRSPAATSPARPASTTLVTTSQKPASPKRSSPAKPSSSGPSVGSPLSAAGDGACGLGFENLSLKVRIREE